MTKTLLLSCCAPCSCYVIEEMAKHQNDFEVVFYNPNIRPFVEYEKRLIENKKLCELHGIPFIELEWDSERWCEMTLGLEDEPEKGKRCDVCFYMRLKRVMKYAKENGFDKVASVLGVSRYKDLAQVNRAAQKASDEEGVPYVELEVVSETEARELGKKLGLYSQKYCGCKPR